MEKQNYTKRKNPLFLLGLMTFCLLLASPRKAVSQQVENAHATKITISITDKYLHQALDTISKLANVRFFYDHAEIDTKKQVSINVSNQMLDRVLYQLLDRLDIEFAFQPNRVVRLKSNPKQVQYHAVNKSYVIKGRVFDGQSDDPLPGASVVVEGNPSKGAITDINGGFSLQLEEGLTRLLIKYLGYEDMLVQVTEKIQTIDVPMAKVDTKMDDVVVTGMAPRKAESFSGSYISVKGDDLKRMNPNNLLEALQYFDPSFRILENNMAGSNPNALPEFRLRGDAQLGAVEPSNMQMLMGDYSNRPNMPLFILDGFEASLQRIVDMDPERVESITILKDAASTAIYGSRAANGVIVFETKKPQKGAINISYSASFGVTVPDLTGYNLMNASEKLEYERRAGLFPETNIPQLNYYNHYREEILRGVDTYWLSAPLRTAVTHRHTLSMQGGDDVIGYDISANYNGQPGVMKESGRVNMGLGFNLQYRNEKWNIMNSITISDTEGTNTPYGLFSDYTKLNQYYRKRDANGGYTKLLDIKSMGSGNEQARIFNPLYNTQFPHKDFNKNFNIAENLNIEFSLLENLRFSAGASFTKSTARSEAFKSMNHTDFEFESDLTKRGSYAKSTGEAFAWSVNAAVNYNFVSGPHVVSTFARWNVEESSSNNISLSALGFPNDNMTDFLHAYEMNNRVNGSEETARSMGLIGQVSYMYDYRFSTDFSVRGDMSSQFGAKTGMAPFWSAGVRWNMNREKWLINTIVSNLVLRASYGVVGSQNYTPYQAIESYSFANLMFPYRSSGVLGAELLGIGNPDLGWSKTKDRSVSMEVGLWDNRFTASASFYSNLTDELLLDYTLAPSVGFRTMTMNVGSVVNKGVDLQMSVTPIADYKNQIQWIISVNAAHNTNKIKKISNVLKAMNEESLQSKDAPLPIYEEGKSTTTLYSVRSLGIDPATGQEVFLKRNGMKTFVWDPADKVPVGDTQPDWDGAITSSVMWKNFTLSVAFTYEWGGYRFNSTLRDKLENTRISSNMDRRALTQRWSEDNRNAQFKAMKIEGYETQQSTRFIQKFNEFRFSSISLGYRFEASRYEFLRRCHIPTLSLNFGMQDIARLSTVKQERGLDYPFARSFNLSLSFLFK